MTYPPSFLPVSTLWALAVLALWVPAPALRGARAWAWRPMLALACAAAFLAGYLDGRGLAAALVFGLLAWGAATVDQPAPRTVLLVLAGLFAFLLALHRIPGFANPVLASNLQLSRGAPPFTLRANVDTALAGIVLAGTFCPRIATLADWRAMLARVWPIVLSTLVVVLGFGLAAGYVRLDLKWTPWSAAFLAVNLLSTCVTEEAFFRGLLLERFARALAGRRGGATVALVLSAVLFGLAHAAGGPALAALATLAGLHYGAAYLRTGRIEGAILAHFALNAMHFVAFTYPGLA